MRTSGFSTRAWASIAHGNRRRPWRLTRIGAALALLALAAACSDSPPTAPAGDFTFLAGDFSSVQVRPGDTVLLPLSSAFRNGYATPVAFALEGPVGFSASFTLCSTVLTPQLFGPPAGVSCVAEVQVDSSVVPGNYALTFIASPGVAPVKRLSIPLAILPPRPLPPTFVVTASVRSIDMARGDSADITFVLSARPSGADDVTFQTSGAFIGISWRWMSSPVVPANSDTVRARVRVSQQGVPGPHTYFVEARLPGRPTCTVLITVRVLEN